jgi:putative oxidoreductase
MNNLLKNKWITLAARIIVAVVFIVYAWGKIGVPRDFVKAVNGYHLVPNSLLNMFSVLLPGIELAAGIALLFGLFTRASSSIIIALLIIFMLAFSASTILGVEIFDCGCSGSENGTEQVSYWSFYLRDIALLIGAIIAFRGRRMLALDNIFRSGK